MGVGCKVGIYGYFGYTWGRIPLFYSYATSNLLIIITMTQEKQSNDEIMEKQINQMEDELKAQHSKNAIFFFFVFGVIIFIWKNASLFSLEALAFFFIGMFLASFLSIPSYLIKMQISKHINLKQVMILKNFYWIFELASDFFVTYFLFYLYTMII